ncbi:MAG: GNAT family N-acetyltransferase [Rubrivivax sp.]
MSLPLRADAIELVAMTQVEFERFQSIAIAEYAADNVAAGRWPAAHAEALAREDFARLLPQGTATPSHWLYRIRVPALDCSVGDLWFALDGEGEACSGYLYNIRVEPEFRGRGHAKAALEALVDRAREMGLASIGLHVFAFNTTALALYRSLGWGITGQLMRKPLR